ncbi:MAG: SDR family oxidoreductase [Elusimicrobia bacterium]|nr:SDR family oxidoreductase [Elusimicrobiota bacterium]
MQGRPAVDKLEEIRRSLAVLESVVSSPELIRDLSEDERVRLMKAAGKLSRPTRLQRSRISRLERIAVKAAAVEADRAARAASGIRAARLAPVFTAPQIALPAPEAPERHLSRPQGCYCCKQDFTKLHHFYDNMCPDCAEFNYAKRFQSADLNGRTAYITGARLKIGYHAALKMLKAGARVIVSTRFPHDAAKRFAAEPDFKEWGNRVKVYGLDLRHSPSVEIFCRYLNQTEDRLDALLNNAAQTVRRPTAFYEHLLPYEALPWSGLSGVEKSILGGHYEVTSALGHAATEEKSLISLDNGSVGIGLKNSAALSQIRMVYDDKITGKDIFPEGKYDCDLQQVDLRTMNTWRMTLAEVPTPELLEVMLINAVAPFILASKLKPLMLKGGATGDKHVVNVTAMEGIFSRGTKTDKHPHTNMAKAALNMLTLTSARDYVNDGIFMNAVDTGWVTDEDPVVHSLRKQAVHDFQPPLDVIDGAARILDPWYVGLNTGKQVHGKFLKDYKEANW